MPAGIEDSIKAVSSCICGGAHPERAEGPTENPQSLRVSLLNIKSQLQSKLGRLKGFCVLEEGPTCTHLSPDPSEAEHAFKLVAFPPDGGDFRG